MPPYYISLVVRNLAFCICKTAKLISAFVFATQIVQSLYFLYPEFQASSHLLWLYNPVCIGPRRKSQRPVSSERGSFCLDQFVAVHLSKVAATTIGSRSRPFCQKTEYHYLCFVFVQVSSDDGEFQASRRP